MLVEAAQLTKQYRVTQTGGSWVQWFRPHYRHVTALDTVSLGIGAREFVGILGRNGAGKSTLIKLLCGLQQASAGTVRILGHDPATQGPDRFHYMAVVFGQKSSLWWDLPLRDSFSAARHIYRLQRRPFEERLRTLCAALHLHPVLDRPVRLLSLGERVKGELVFNLLHRPQLILLDEPTIGLDIVSKAHLRDFLRGLVADDGCSVILTSHDMGDIDHCCTRICVLEEGRLTFDGSRDAFHRYLAPGCEIRVTPLGEMPASIVLERTRDAVARVVGVRTVACDPITGQLRIVAAPDLAVAPLLATLESVLGPSSTFTFQQQPVSFEQAVLHKMRAQEPTA